MADLIIDLLGISIMLVVCTYTDIACFEVSDRAIILSAIACVVINIARCVQTNSMSAIYIMLFGAGCGFVIGLIMFLCGMGFGDVKMMVVIGGYLGVGFFIVSLMIAAVSGALYGLLWLKLVRKQSLRSPLPFVPFLSLGCIAAFICKTFMGGLL
jgi:prepilin signal peptidase PulO-like enzyme (type II secretory pathway)